MRVLGLLTLVCCVLVAGAPVRAQDQHEKALQLMQVTGADQLAEQVIGMVVPEQIDLVRAADPKLDEQFLQRLEDAVLAEALAAQDELRDLLAATYERHFTSAELDELIAFYSAPLGQKIVRVMPAVMEEIGLTGGTWGQAVAERVVERLKRGSD